jgi:hypothetical protein
LIDSLDLAWDSSTDVRQFASVIQGLLTASLDVKKSLDNVSASLLGRASADPSKPVCMAAVFLRTDIFDQISPYLRETDKIAIEKIDWPDPNLLVRVIEDRYLLSAKKARVGNDFWRVYFPLNWGCATAKEQILNTILPRPRDLIFFVSQALANAANAAHEIVEEQDLDRAYSEYSYYALGALRTEFVINNQLGANIEEIVSDLELCNPELSLPEAIELLGASHAPERAVEALISGGLFDVRTKVDSASWENAISGVCPARQLFSRARAFEAKAPSGAVPYRSLRIHRAFRSALGVDL